MSDDFAIYICLIPSADEQDYFEINDQNKKRLHKIEKILLPVITNYALSARQNGSRLAFIGRNLSGLHGAYSDILNILHMQLPSGLNVKCFINVLHEGLLFPLDMTEEGDNYEGRRDYSNFSDYLLYAQISLSSEPIEEKIEKFISLSKSVSVIEGGK